MKSSARIASTFLAASAFLAVTSTASAAYLYLDPATATVAKGKSFTVKVGMDAEGEPVTGTDMYIQYDPQSVRPGAVKNGTFFPFVSHRDDNGKFAVSGVILDPEQTKKDKGVVATVAFESLNGSSGTLSFYCDIKKNNTSKVVRADVNATNLIDCVKNQGASYQGSGGGLFGAIAQFFSGLLGSR